MSIYRFRVLIDHSSEAFRDIEIASEQTFLEFHNAIKEAFGFKGQEMACFYVSDADWNKGIEVPLADMGFAEEGQVPLLMHEVEVGDHVRDPDQRFVYAYDFLHMWMFLVERIGTTEPEPDATYPRVVMAMGHAPDEHAKDDDLEDPMAALTEEDLDEREADPYDEDDDDAYGGEFGEGYEEEYR
ncbi:MAG: hypothetical protein KJZ58_05925 [Flavobacteriales bacterium]|nr:hypothetical protein [Flavobacteriales bacterium]